jgi:hypothetical protein
MAQIAAMIADKDNPLSSEYAAKDLQARQSDEYAYNPNQPGGTGGYVPGGDSGAFDFGSYPENEKLRLKQEIMEIFTEISAKIKDNVSSEIDLPPQVLLGMWYTENGGKLASDVSQYYLGNKAASAYTDFTLGADKMSENEMWGSGKTGKIKLSDIDLSKSGRGRDSYEAIGVMQLTIDLLPAWLYNIYTPRKMTSKEAAFSAGISAEKTLCSDFGAGNQTNVRGKSGGGWERGQIKDSAFSALKGHDVFRPHAGYLPDTVYTTAVRILQDTERADKSKLGGLSAEARAEILIAQGLTAHNHGSPENNWTPYFIAMQAAKGTLKFDTQRFLAPNAAPKSRFLVPRLVEQGRPNDMATWYWKGANNPNRDFIQTTYYSSVPSGWSDWSEGQHAHARGYALSCINNGYALWDIWSGEIANAKQTGGGFTGSGQTSESNARAAAEDAFPKSYGITVINPAYPVTDTEYNALSARRKAIKEAAFWRGTRRQKNAERGLRLRVAQRPAALRRDVVRPSAESELSDGVYRL